MHFDIIVPDDLKDKNIVYSYGKEFLASKNEAGSKLEVEECRFCHMEEATPELKQSIKSKGYGIIEMKEIPAVLPENPSRTEMILHLRAHHEKYRFADFKNKSTEAIQQLISRL